MMIPEWDQNHGPDERKFKCWICLRLWDKNGRHRHLRGYWTSWCAQFGLIASDARPVGGENNSRYCSCMDVSFGSYWHCTRYWRPMELLVLKNQSFFAWSSSRTCKLPFIQLFYPNRNFPNRDTDLKHLAYRWAQMHSAQWALSIEL